jgi:hypothetical protein
MNLRNAFFLASIGAASLTHAQFTGFVNKGLIGVGRLPAALFDKAGQGTNDTLGGFSAMAIDTHSLVYAGGKISGTIVGLPDRGFGERSGEKPHDRNLTQENAAIKGTLLRRTRVNRP